MSTAPEARVLLSLATYNERENLPELLRLIQETVPAADVLIIDDNSPDGTGLWADEAAAKDARIHVIHRAGKLGLGTATLAAMRYAMDNKYDLLMNMDADFSHHPRYLPALLAGMKDYDLMIGSRYVPGGGTIGWPWSRRLMSAGVNRLVRLLLRVPVRDASGAFRCYRISMLARTRLDRIISRGYSFQQETLYRCALAGCTMGELPIIFEERRAGSSKVNLWEAVRSLSIIVWLGMLRPFGLGK
jgi:dolichol-phosphate mannosyltransferase